ncbi:hypothetical protein [Ensifer sp. ENS12]|jgi:hypothetical protein|uniref:hypothetical protein n=1 Tax=Ensifer sp. ENS12 TaxID=2854774 RepID=UPI000DE5A4B9|nr:hypothetical protein [Ensifer sp. ENS12]MBV7522287.1 hypothetical protein [Ensifer sp. ENS12]
MLAKLHDTSNGRREVYINPRYVSAVMERFGRTEVLLNVGGSSMEVQVSESVAEAGAALNKATQND